MVNFLIILIDLYSRNALILGIFHIKYPSAQGKTQACLDLFANSFKHSVAFSLALSLSLSVSFFYSRVSSARSLICSMLPGQIMGFQKIPQTS